MEIAGGRPRRLARTAVVVGVLGLLAACAGAPPAIPTAAMATYRLREARAGVQVALDPFFLPARARQAFTGGEDFAEHGLLPVQVILENHSQAEVRVDPREATLISPRGGRASSLAPEDAFALIKLPVGWWALGAGYVGGSTQAYRNEARRRDIQARALTAQTVPPGGSTSGFLYFQLGENEMNLAGSRVVLPVGRAGGALAFEIPLEGRRDIPTPTPAARRDPGQPAKTEGTGGKGIIIRSP
ncbi:MAG: hypothetical protein ACE147_05315 [Candidatus Methylomirabilales bacterium]